jgi:hypothetical protein
MATSVTGLRVGLIPVDCNLGRHVLFEEGRHYDVGVLCQELVRIDACQLIERALKPATQVVAEPSVMTQHATTPDSGGELMFVPGYSSDIGVSQQPVDNAQQSLPARGRDFGANPRTILRS